MTTPRRQLLNYLIFLRDSGALFLENPTRLGSEAKEQPTPISPPGPSAPRSASPKPTAPTARIIETRPAPAPAPPRAAAAAPIISVGESNPPRKPAPGRIQYTPPKKAVWPWPDLPIEERRAALAAAAVRAEACRACVLGNFRKQAVYGVGSPMAKIMFIGEAPGAEEDTQGEPFVGRAGQLLTKMIKAIGFAREDIYIANTLKCRPPDNRPPQPQEKEACRHFLLEQIRIIRPQMIVALGTHAAKSVTGKDVGITRLRETNWHEFEGVPVLATFHPSYLLRDPNKKRDAWVDMQEVHRYYTELNPDDPRKMWSGGMG